MNLSTPDDAPKRKGSRDGKNSPCQWRTNSGWMVTNFETTWNLQKFIPVERGPINSERSYPSRGASCGSGLVGLNRKSQRANWQPAPSVVRANRREV